MCPAISGNAAVRSLGLARRIEYVAVHMSVCGGCFRPTTAGTDRVVPMDGAGANGATQWWHKACLHGQLAVVQSYADDSKAHTRTPEIDAIIQWVKATNLEARHAIVRAGPGAGKTQLVVRVTGEVVRMQPQQVAPLVLAFNKDAVVELQNRSVTGARTFHSYGLSKWKALHPNVKVRRSKIRDLLKAEFPRQLDQPDRHKYSRDVMPLLKHILKLVTLSKAYALDPRSGDFELGLDELIAMHGITKRLEWELKGKAVAEPLQRIRRIVTWVLRESIATAAVVIDYDDMVYMPVLNRDVGAHASGWVIVDECQDMDKARSRMAELLTGDRGRLLIVGDEHQSLYGYTGAGAEVLQELRTTMGIATELPLTCSWRLPRRHVQAAFAFMHNNGRENYTLEYAENAEEGMIARVGNFTRFPLDPGKDHAILCRTNACTPAAAPARAHGSKHPVPHEWARRARKGDVAAR